jgi:glycerophosphoryl diester phosphodiesterase
MIQLKYLVVIVFLLTFLVHYFLAADSPSFNEKFFIAHRGLSSIAPENTMSSFNHAAFEGFNMIELDVQMSKDKHLVVIHDITLKRTAGLDKKISDLTLKELKTLDVGEWYDESFAGEKIPTLDEVFMKFKDRHHLLIDLKRPSIYPGIEKVLTDKILDTYSPHEFSMLSIQSTELKSIMLLNTFLPQIKKGLVISSHIPYHQLNELGAKIDFITLHKRCLNYYFYQQAKRAKLTLYIWGIHNKYDYKNVKRLAVDGVVVGKRFD